MPSGYQVLVGDGDQVEAGTALARSKPKRRKKTDEEEKPAEVLATTGGRVEVKSKRLAIVWEDVEEREYLVPASAYLLAEDGATIRAGDALTAGPLNPHDILRIRGKEGLHRYLISEVQRVYRSQGVSIHDKHIEVILRQMLRRVQVDSPGDAEFIPGQIVDRFEFQERNAKVLAEGGEPATAKSVLLGVTRASLLTDSFLAAASFQETTRVLTEAATTGAKDKLLGLKENVIIGRLIPARPKVPDSVEQQPPESEETDGLVNSWLQVAEAAMANGHESPVMAEVPKPEIENTPTEETRSEETPKK